jgi:DNA-binding IscR family transcriptional regulator
VANYLARNCHFGGGGTKGERKQRYTLEKALILEIWAKANIASIEVLRGYTLQDLYQETETRTQNSPMYYI